MPTVYSVDLHMHSTYSDGVLTPAQLVQRADALGIHHLALSDHDTLAGVPSFLKAIKERNEQKPDAVPMVGIPAVEVDVNRLHILAYGVHPDHPRLAQLFANTDEQRRDRVIKIMDLLDAQGVSISQEVRDCIIQKSHASRLHVAQALVDMQAVRDVSHAFDRYLQEGRSCFVPMCPLTLDQGVPVKQASQVVEILKSCGAVVVLAHPMRIKHLTKNMRCVLIDSLVEAGLDGIEVFHPSANLGDVAHLLSLATKKGLLVTGGSDFHNDTDPKKGLGQMPEGWNTALHDVQALLSKMDSISIDQKHMKENEDV